MNKKSKYKTVYVKWVDSYGCTSGWRAIEKIKELVHCETIGFVVSETKDIISLANSIGYETQETQEQANGIITIPKRCIVKRKEVKI